MEWKKIVAGVAPTIATALGGPIAGTATKFIAAKLLGKADATEDEIGAYLAGATPEDLAKLRDIDNDFKLQMKKLNIDLVRLGQEDRKDARDLAKANMWPQIVISIVFIGGYLWTVSALFDGELNLVGTNRDMALMLLGVLTAGIPMILRFWFGGSPQDEVHLDRIYNSTPKQD